MSNAGRHSTNDYISTVIRRELRLVIFVITVKVVPALFLTEHHAMKV
jgi:hypothetical protein